MMNRIVMVHGYKFPPDIRIEKEALSLVNNGYEVFVLTFGGDESPDVVKDYKGIKIINCPSENNIFKKCYNTFIFYLYHYYPLFGKFIKEKINELSPDFIHIHDIQYFKTAFKSRNNRKIKVIIDLHENRPSALQEYRKSKHGLELLKYIIGGRYSDWVKYEKWCVENADGVIVVVDEAKDRIVKSYNIDNKKIAIVSNTLEKSLLKMKPDMDNVNKIKDNKFIILYLGGFGPHRGIDTAVKSISIVKEKIPNVKLRLVGGRNFYVDDINKIVKSMNIQDYVEIINWIDYNKIVDYIYSSDICIVPHNRSEHTDTTVPHKLFQYMAYKKPVIVSDAPPLKRIVEENNCGLVFKGNDYIDMANKIIEIYNNLDNYGENGFNAVMKKYIFEETDGMKLVQFYKGMAK